MNKIDKTLDERGARYGEFPRHASITQGIKDAMSKGRNWDSLDDDMKEALEMTAHKIGRILNGDPNYIDSWHDVIGYTRLVEQRLEQAQAPKVQQAFDPNQAATFGPLPTAEKPKGISPLKTFCDCPSCALKANLKAHFEKAGFEVVFLSESSGLTD